MNWRLRKKGNALKLSRIHQSRKPYIIASMIDHRCPQLQVMLLYHFLVLFSLRKLYLTSHSLLIEHRYPQLQVLFLSLKNNEQINKIKPSSHVIMWSCMLLNDVKKNKNLCYWTVRASNMWHIMHLIAPYTPNAIPSHLN